MCGIFCLLNNGGTTETAQYRDETTGTYLNTSHVLNMNFIDAQFQKGKGRGPETSKLIEVSDKTILGFHRLAINGLNSVSDQPIFIDNIYLICNGEIYNYKELYKIMPNIEPQTNSDCEVIIHLYKLYGIEQTLLMLDGVFSFILVDYNKTQDNTYKLIAARDPYGVRPLFMMLPKNSSSCRSIGFASEMKSLIGIADNDYINKKSVTINQFLPGSYLTMSKQASDATYLNSCWTFNSSNNIKYHKFALPQFVYNVPMIDYCLSTLKNIQQYLDYSVMKRALITDRPIACLLSGGLDSSLITALVNDIHKNVLKAEKPLETYSIGVKGAEDLKYARIVADYLGTNHTEIILTEDDFFNAIPDVIRTIESYDTTTVRASIGNYLIGKYISEHSDAKVIFNGDGSDEMCGGYLYMHSCEDPIEFDKECKRLLNNIHSFDVLRSDRCISTHGLEPRTPFLDRNLVSFYMSIHPNVRCHSNKSNQSEKYLLRTAFSKQHYLNRNDKPLLPENVLWRTKEAFSDGVSSTSRSLYQIIQDKIELDNDISSIIDEINWDYYTHNNPKTKEQKYYRYLFEQHYGDCGHVIPYFWMPKYVHCHDSSARTLNIYNKVLNKKNTEQESTSVNNVSIELPSEVTL